MERHTYAEIAFGLDAVAAVPWDNSRHARPVTDLAKLADAAIAKTGYRFHRAVMHPHTAAVVASSAEFEQAARYMALPYGELPDRYVSAYCRQHFAELLKKFIDLDPALNEQVAVGVVILECDDAVMTLRPDQYGVWHTMPILPYNAEHPVSIPLTEPAPANTTVEYKRLARIRGYTPAEPGAGRMR